MRRAPSSRIEKVIRGIARREAQTVEDASREGAGVGSGSIIGSNDPITGDWHAAGISNITSTADPFYSARG